MSNNEDVGMVKCICYDYIYFELYLVIINDIIYYEEPDQKLPVFKWTV